METRPAIPSVPVQNLLLRGWAQIVSGKIDAFAERCAHENIFCEDVCAQIHGCDGRGLEEMGVLGDATSQGGTRKLI